MYNLVGVMQYHIVVLTCTSLLISDVEHLFTYLLPIYIFSLEECLFLWPIFYLLQLSFYY